ncbi:helix-turn-helix domain-containing protein [uncultured Clostridium sp.]|uniref:helix-turn-helix domain-containing protein n=1 Tax=uncultured Clostridium sp. TaxID=59620 RepID=UPI0025D6E18A|nr:helix-turn-helix transcriptional regulator [uncultured Clostridium sp.]
MKKNYFHENLKFIRKSLNFSQKEISNYLKVNPASYSNYETGRRQPDLDTLIKICDFLNIEIDKLLTENLSNDINFLENIKNVIFNSLDFSKETEDINLDLRKNILLELEDKKKLFFHLRDKEIPKKLKEIDRLINYINEYDNLDLEMAQEISFFKK